MHAVIESCSRNMSPSQKGPLYDEICVYGGLAFRQLADLRHRGAFSTVAQTFTAWCLLCERSGDLQLQKLPRIWYNVSRLFDVVGGSADEY